MARRKTGFQRFSRRQGSHIWAVILLDDVTISNAAPIGNPIVATTDFAAAGGQSKCTLMAIRGWLSWRQGSVVGADIAFGAIVLKDEDEDVTGASMDPTAAPFYGESDVLWTTGFVGVGQQTLVGTRPGTHMTEQINVKARRKMKAGQEISLQVGSVVSNNIRLSGVLRALLKIT